MLKQGDEAPDFALKGSDDQIHRLTDHRGHRVVLVFYPLDFSPTCTKQHGCMRDEMKAFDLADARVFGISVDSAWAHKAYAKDLGIRYPLLADFHPKGEVAAKYGVYHPDKGISGRVTFVIGPDGIIREVLAHDFPELPEMGPLLAAIRASE